MAAIFFLRKPIVPCSPNIFQAELEEKRRLAAEASPAGGDSHSDVGDRSGAEALAEGWVEKGKTFHAIPNGQKFWLRLTTQYGRLVFCNLFLGN